MSQFLGTHQSRLDAKNRVSIPAGFRSVLRAQLAPAATPDTASLVLRPSHTHDCIEVWPATVFHALEASLNRHDRMPISPSPSTAMRFRQTPTRKAASSCQTISKPMLI
jgi:DNA-binding transcriptional regulator/RsmH inhibitor MraZ